MNVAEFLRAPADISEVIADVEIFDAEMAVAEEKVRAGAENLKRGMKAGM